MRTLWLPIIILASVLGGALAAKVYTKFKADCGNVPCVYVQIRLSVFKQVIASRAAAPAYLVIGDSLTEIGRWPQICGFEPVAAGISGARTDTWLPHAKAIAEDLKPKIIVLALGTNDVLSGGRLGPYEQLVSSLSGFRVVGVPVHVMPGVSRQVVKDANTRIAHSLERTAEQITAATTDGIHFTKEDYGLWFAAIEKAACERN